MDPEGLNPAVDTLDAVGLIDVPPDPAVLKAVGLNHDFESAVADLVDNSVDAGAGRVLIRFIVKRGLVSQILVIDDGDGMDEETIDSAMQLGRPTHGRARALGHFGMGLKAASFSQSSVLTVMSRRAGCAPQGRRLFRDSRSAGFTCEVLPHDKVGAALDVSWPGLDTAHGTVVRWDSLRTVPASSDRTVTNLFIEQRQAALRHHLGLVFHRLLENGRVAISVDVFDRDSGGIGFLFNVDPIDPFAYTRSGAPGYPKTIVASVGGGADVNVHCHIWPGGSDSSFFRLFGGSPDRFQGFYLYRYDRLLSVGGWNGVVVEHKRWTLARACVDIEGHPDAFAMSMEKSTVRLGADLTHAIEIGGSSDGTSFHDYLDEAAAAFKESNRRPRRRRQMLPAGKGFHPVVKRIIEREVDVLTGEEPIEIRWTNLPGGSLIEVDRDQQTLWLNSRYRAAILKGTRGGVNDSPLIKAALYLLFEDVFRGFQLGSRDRDSIAVWNHVLTAAAEIEDQGFHDG
jgi:hypothetical protein